MSQPDRMPAPDLVTASYDSVSGTVVGRLGIQPYGRRIVTMAIQGPQSSTLRIYRGAVISAAYLIVAVSPAADRTYDSVEGAAPIRISAGEIVTFAWSGGAVASGQTATATIRSEVY